MLGNLPGKAPVSLGQMLACRETILISKKTASGETRVEAEINKHRMKTRVADRGGRVTESNVSLAKETFAQQEEQRNMPKWQKRVAPPPGSDRGNRGGGRGNYRGNRGNKHHSPARNQSPGNFFDLKILKAMMTLKIQLKI